jgi:predicted transglutaminase-like cysteine proteinase
VWRRNRRGFIIVEGAAADWRGNHRAMLRRLFGIGCACAFAPARAALCRSAACTGLSPATLAHARHDFDALARDTAALPASERIAYANLAINRLVAFADDAELGATDVWLTPLETLARGRGDCEDIAIAKFFLLLAAGLDACEVRLLYARRRDETAAGRSGAHVVALARRPFTDPLVLDNLTPATLPISGRDDLAPVFSFDRSELRAGVDGPRRGDALQRLHAWRDLLGRMATQP